MSACACLIATTQAHSFAPIRYKRTPLQQWPHHLLQMLRWEEQLCLTGLLHLRWQSVLTPVIKEHHLLRTTPRPTTASTAPRLATPPLHNNTPYVQLFTALTLEEYQLLSLQQATPLSQLDYTLPVHCIPGDLRMPHYNSHCSASHYLRQPTHTTTAQHQCTQLATTTPTSLFNYRLNNNSF